MTAAELVAMLEGVRQSGEGWMAKCPAHEDRSASLSVAAGSDGRILLHCFAECSAYEIVGALGLELSDLFPPKIDTFAGSSRPPKHNPADLLRVIALESAVVACAAHVLANGGGLSAKDYARLELAEERINEARRYA